MSGPSFDLTIEPELFRESEATYLQLFHMRIIWESTGSVRRSDRAGRLRGDRRVMRAAPSRDPVDAQRNIGPGPDSESIRPRSALQSRSGRESSRRTGLIPRVVEQSAPQPLRWYPLVSQSGAHSACKRHGDHVFLGARTAVAYKTKSWGACGRHLSLGTSSKVAIDGPFEAVLGKTRRTEF